jgi:hypothetical protein
MNWKIAQRASLQKLAVPHDPPRTHVTQPSATKGTSVDFGFIIQQSNDSHRYNQYKGLHGHTWYVLLADHFSGMLYGKTFKTKAPPISWLNGWLATHAHVCPDRYV